MNVLISQNWEVIKTVFAQKKKTNKSEIKIKIHILWNFICWFTWFNTTDNSFNDKSNENDRIPYEKVLKISTSFVYINKGIGIKDKANREILNNLYLNIQDNSKLISEEYWKSCLFVVNIFNQLTDEEKDINGIRELISTILFDNNNKRNQINAKHYFEYLKESTLLQDI